MRLLDKLRLRLRSVVRPARVERELDREIGFHLESQIEENLAAGMTPPEARVAALRTIGQPQSIKEACRDKRGLGFLEILIQNLQYTSRSLRKTPGFTFVAVLIMTLGIGASTAIFSIVNGVLLNPLPYPEADRLVALWESAPALGFPNMSVSYPNYRDLTERTRSFAGIGAWRYDSGILRTDGRTSELVRSRMISANLLPVLGIPVDAGRTFTPGEDRPGGAPVALVTRDLAERLAGSVPKAVGRTLEYRGRLFTVVGVLSGGYRVWNTGPIGSAQIFTPLGQETDAPMQRRDFHPSIWTVGRLLPNVSIEEARAELPAVVAGLREQYPESFIASSVMVRPMYEDVLGAEIPRTLMLLFGAVILVLLIAAANVASLVVARSISREHELAIRSALGASRRRILGQLLTEGIVLSLAGGMAGAGLAQGLAESLVRAWPVALPQGDRIGVDWRVLAFAVFLSVATGVAFSLIPTRRRRSLVVFGGLGTGERSVARMSGRTQSALVVSEIAIAVLLLTAAWTTIRTIRSMTSTDPGFVAQNVAVMNVTMTPSDESNGERVLRRWQEALRTARNLPDVSAAAVTNVVPMTQDMNMLLYRRTSDTRPLEEMPSAVATYTTPEYLDVMGIPLRAGRYVTDFDQPDTEPVAVIDDVFAKTTFPDEEPIGQQILVLGTPVRIVGLVGHVHQFGLRAEEHATVRSQMYLSFAQLPEENLRGFDAGSIVVRTRSELAPATAPLREALFGAGWGVEDLRTMEQIVADSAASERFLLLLFNTFGILALVLAAVGLYGVVSYIARQRTREFGMRMALGARAGQIAHLVLARAARMFLAGSAIGVVLTLALSRVWESAIETMEPIGVAGIVMAALVLAGAMVPACYLPARRASRLDPMASLRHD